MEAKIEKRKKKKAMHVVVFITFLSPGPHLLSDFFLMYIKLYRFKFLSENVARFHPHCLLSFLYVNGEYYYVHYWSAANALSPILEKSMCS